MMSVMAIFDNYDAEWWLCLRHCKQKQHKRLLTLLESNSPSLLYCCVRVYLQQFGSGCDVIVETILSSE